MVYNYPFLLTLLLSSFLLACLSTFFRLSFAFCSAASVHGTIQMNSSAGSSPPDITLSACHLHSLQVNSVVRPVGNVDVQLDLLILFFLTSIYLPACLQGLSSLGHGPSLLGCLENASTLWLLPCPQKLPWQAKIEDE